MANPRAQAKGKLLQENERVIMVCLTAGKLLVETANGNVETELAFGQTYARPAGVEHNIVNPNGNEFSFVEIELK